MLDRQIRRMDYGYDDQVQSFELNRVNEYNHYYFP